MSRIGKPIETESRLLVPEAGRRVEWGVTADDGYRVSFWGDENVLKLVVVLVY